MASEGNGELGVNATGTALAEARVEELVYDVDADVDVEELARRRPPSPTAGRATTASS